MKVGGPGIAIQFSKKLSNATFQIIVNSIKSLEVALKIHLFKLFQTTATKIETILIFHLKHGALECFKLVLQFVFS